MFLTSFGLSKWFANVLLCGLVSRKDILNVVVIISTSPALFSLQQADPIKNLTLVSKLNNVRNSLLPGQSHLESFDKFYPSNRKRKPYIRLELSHVTWVSHLYSEPSFCCCCFFGTTTTLTASAVYLMSISCLMMDQFVNECVVCERIFRASVNKKFHHHVLLDRRWRGVCVWAKSQRPAWTRPHCQLLNTSALLRLESAGHKCCLWLGFYSSSYWWLMTAFHFWHTVVLLTHFPGKKKLKYEFPTSGWRSIWLFRVKPWKHGNHSRTVLIILFHTDCGNLLACGSNVFGQLGIDQMTSHSAELVLVEVSTW